MEELEESELGTQEYWNDRYKNEIINFENHGDPGEVWFGEDVSQKIIDWMNKNKTVTKTTKLIDIGCGNGMLLIELTINGYTNLTGIDYSDEAIILAKAVAKEKNFHKQINYFSCNILNGLNENYDIIHDKGTYDAISLSNEAKQNRQTYIETVYKHLNDSGYFIITSCNWTKFELDDIFRNYFVCFDVIPTPQFTFGGKIGNVVSCIIYKKILNQ